MTTGSEVLDALRRSRRRSAWTLLGLVVVMAGGGTLSMLFPDSPAILVLSFAAFLLVPVAIYLLAVQAQLLAVQWRVRRGRIDSAPFAGGRWSALAVVIGVPAVLLWAVLSYVSERNASYELFAVGDRLGEIMIAVSTHYAKHGRLPATNADLGLPGEERVRYRMFDLEQYADVRITYRIVDGRVQLAIEGDPRRTIAFAPVLSGSELQWDWQPAGTLQGRERSMVRASVTHMVREKAAGPGEEARPIKPDCVERQPPGASAQAPAQGAACAGNPG